MKKRLGRLFKPTLAVLLLLVMLVTALPSAALTAEAATAASGASGKWYNLSWSFNESSGELRISGNGAMRAPDTFGEFPWEEFCYKVKSIVIERGVTSIALWAFGGYTSNVFKNLTSVSLPNTLTEIGTAAFHNANKLTSITIPDSITKISYSTFQHCSSLTSVNLPDSVTLIDGEAFWGCSSLTSIRIPDGVTEIGYDVFTLCNSLTEISLPGNEITFGDNALGSKVKRLEIRKGLRVLGDWINETINEQWHLESLVLPDTLEEITDSCNIPKDAIIFCGSAEQWSAIKKEAWYDSNFQTHDYEVIKQEANAHTLKCRNCGDEQSNAPHTFISPKMIDYQQHRVTCSGCGLEATVGHEWGAAREHDYRDIHLRPCACGALLEEAHTVTKAERVNSQYHRGTCECGAVRSVLHRFGKWTEKDNNTHERVCKDCGEVSSDAHRWEDGVCKDCDAEQKTGCAASLGGGIGTAALALAAAIFATRKRKKR